ncbi:hypothetical protein SEA_KARP_194 [Streptomyces phage Karp]|nr:hypothetical protein SEA_KARP_194 [Streptomyces phage Karp]
MTAQDLGATPQQLINKAEGMLNQIAEYPTERDEPRIIKARALIELAQAKIALKEFHRAR